MFADLQASGGVIVQQATRLRPRFGRVIEAFVYGDVERLVDVGQVRPDNHVLGTDSISRLGNLLGSMNDAAD
ncbi:MULTISPECIES: hypothetical protein [Cupriavidus]